MKRITRNRRLTPEEAAEYRAVRGQIEREKPEINARIRAQMAQHRKAAPGSTPRPHPARPDAESG